MSTHATSTRYRLVGLAALLALAACGGGNGYGSAANSGGSTKASSGSGGSAGGGLGTTSSPLGTILTDSAGKTLYAFAADAPGTSNCSGQCLVYWPLDPAEVTPPKAPTGVTATLGVLDRGDGTKQLTVDGYPVYTYVGDQAPGDTTGQGKNLSGGLWWVLGTDGHWIKGDSTSPSSYTSSSGGRGGY